MAEEETTDQEPDGDGAPRKGKGLNRILLLLGVVVLAGGAGFGASLILGGPREVGADEPDPGDGDVSVKGDADYEYIVDFPPVTVNLDVPNVNRYVRTTLAIAVKKGQKEDIEKIVVEHTPRLTNVLTVYLSSLTLDDVRGEEKLNAIRREIRNEFNKALWPKGKPRIERILFNEFKIQ